MTVRMRAQSLVAFWTRTASAALACVARVFPGPHSKAHVMKLHLLKYRVALGIGLIAGAALGAPANAAPPPGGHPGPHPGHPVVVWHGSGPGWWGWGLGLGLGLGLEAEYLANPYLYEPYPGYYYPYPGYDFPVTPPSQVVAPPPPAAGGPPAPGSAPPASWFYCDSAKTYFPYVQNCPEPWRIVPAAPPGPPR